MKDGRFLHFNILIKNNKVGRLGLGIKLQKNLKPSRENCLVYVISQH